MEWMLLPLKRYAEFSGRSCRQEFWLYTLMLFIFWLIFFAILMIAGLGAAMTASPSNPTGMMGMFASLGIVTVIFGIAWLGLLIPTLAVQIRRLHDTDRSGWWIMIYWGPVLLGYVFSIGGALNQSMGLTLTGSLVSLMGFIGAIVLLVFWCLPGTSGANQYGPDPLGGLGDLSKTFQ